MTAFRRTLTTTSDLADAGLISDDRAAQIAAVGTRYAVAVTPAIAELIDRSDLGIGMDVEPDKSNGDEKEPGRRHPAT